MKRIYLCLIVVLTLVYLSADPTFINTYPYQDLFPPDFTFGGSHCCNIIEAIDGGFILEVFINANWDIAWYPQAMFFKIAENGDLEWRKCLYDEEWQGPYFNSFISNGVDRYYGVGDYFGGPTFFYVFDDSCNVLSYRILGEEDSLNVYINSMKLLDDGFIMAGQLYEESVYAGPFIMKTDFEGNIIFQKDDRDFGINYHIDELNTIIQTSDNGFLACGFREMNPGTGRLYKFDAQGDTLWTIVQDYRKFHSLLEYNNETIYTIYAGDDYGYLSKYDQNGNFIAEYEIITYLFDQVTSSRMFKSNDGNIIILYNAAEGEIHKVTPDGEVLWSRDYLDNGQPAYPDYIGVNDKKCFQLSNGDYVYCGTTDRQSLYPEFVLLRVDEEGNLPVSEDTIVPQMEYTLSNYPNPFNPFTTISYELPVNVGNVIIEIYNIKGQKIETIPFENKTITWDASKYSSGIYFCKLVNVKDGNILSVKKVTLLK